MPLHENKNGSDQTQTCSLLTQLWGLAAIPEATALHGAHAAGLRQVQKAGVLWSKIKVPSVSSNKHKNSEAPLTFSVLKIFLIWIKRWSPIWSRTVSLSFAGKHHTPGYKKGDITRMDCSLFCPILFYAKVSQPGVGRLHMRKPEVTMLLEEYSRKWYFHTLKRRISALKKIITL